MDEQGRQFLQAIRRAASELNTAALIWSRSQWSEDRFKSGYPFARSLDSQAIELEEWAERVAAMLTDSGAGGVRVRIARAEDFRPEFGAYLRAFDVEFFEATGDMWVTRDQLRIIAALSVIDWVRDYRGRARIAEDGDGFAIWEPNVPDDPTEWILPAADGRFEVGELEAWHVLGDDAKVIDLF